MNDKRQVVPIGWRPGRIGLALGAGALALGLLGMSVAVVMAKGSSGAGSGPKARPPAVNPRQFPRYDPANFTGRIDNAWFPLRPGITYIYRGVKDGKPARDVFTVTHQVATIDGVPCRVVHDRLYLSGWLEEKTSDYYTQDDNGNVWYFGEDTQELDKSGNVISREGSWRTGKNGAEAGIFMEANPQVGHSFQQEFYSRHAEDHYQVLSLTAQIDVPYGHFGRNKLRRNVQLTKEWTPLEPNVLDHKYYVRGIGQVKEIAVKGPLESASLVKIVKR